MSRFAGKRVSRSHTITLAAEPATVFPLFTPEEEKKWAAGWDYELIYPPDPDGTPAAEMVFKTATHDHNHHDAIWLMSKYDPGRFQIEYIRLEPDVKIGKIQVDCSLSGAQETVATITYTYTGLSETGNEFIETFTEEHYRHFISTWEKSINHYLETGKTLPAV